MDASFMNASANTQYRAAEGRGASLGRSTDEYDPGKIQRAARTLGSAAEQLEGSWRGLVELAEHAERIADHLAGPVPDARSAASGSAGLPAPSVGAVDDLNDRVDALHYPTHRIMLALNRIGSRVGA